MERLALLTLAASLAAGCASPSTARSVVHFDGGANDLRGQGQGQPPDLRHGDPDLLAGDPVDLLAPDVADLAQGAADLAQGGQPGCHPVVNEVMTGTSQFASEEFVELFNPCGDVDVTNWALAYHSAANGAGPNLATFHGTFKAGSYFVLCGTHLVNVGAVFCDGPITGGLSDKGGGIGLRDANGQLVDSVAYDVLTAPNTFTESNPAPNPPVVGSPGNSISRLPNGSDTDDNSVDFKPSGKATPRAPNQ